MSKIKNDDNPVWHKMLYSCTHIWQQWASKGYILEILTLLTFVFNVICANKSPLMKSASTLTNPHYNNTLSTCSKFLLRREMNQHGTMSAN